MNTNMWYKTFNNIVVTMKITSVCLQCMSHIHARTHAHRQTDRHSRARLHARTHTQTEELSPEGCAWCRCCTFRWCLRLDDIFFLWHHAKLVTGDQWSKNWWIILRNLVFPSVWFHVFLSLYFLSFFFPAVWSSTVKAKQEWFFFKT